MKAESMPNHDFAQPAYELLNELSHFEKYGLSYDRDLEIVPYEGYLTPGGFETVEFSKTAVFPHPNTVTFTGDLEFIRHLDFPSTDNRWCVMSQRMLGVLTSVGHFSHRLIPVTIKPRFEVLPETERTKNFDRSSVDFIGRNYVAVQLTEFADVFDWSNSIYTRSQTSPDYLQKVEEYVFKIPKNGLPPIFRIEPNPVVLFVSSAARAALKKAQIAGTRYLSLRGYRYQEESEWVDIELKIHQTKNF